MDVAIKTLSRIKDEVDVNIIKYGVDFAKTVALASSLGLRLNALPKVSHDGVSEYYWDADVVIDQFKFGALGMVSLEAIACGRPVVTYVSPEYKEYDDFPLKDVNTVDKVAEAIKNASQKLWKTEYNYLINHHQPEETMERIYNIYTQEIKI